MRLRQQSSYYAHIRFNSPVEKTPIDAGIYERFNVSDYGYINIHKFNDINNNQIQDANEKPLSGWTFNVSSSDGTQRGSITTGQDGSASYGPVPAHASYRITEIRKNANWESTLPGSYRDVTINVSKYDPKVPDQNLLLFGNKLIDSQIGLLKFYDFNGNGVQDSSEPSIQGWVFSVVGGPLYSRYNLVTNENGIVQNLIADEPTAQYTVRDVLPNDYWECTNQPLEKSLSLQPGEIREEKYGNRLKPAVITIYKFRDDNKNGVWDKNDEPGLAWDFEITGSDGRKEKVSTDQNGRLGYSVLFPMPTSLNVIPTITLTVRELPKAGCWTPTTPIERTVTVYPGDHVEMEPFGNCLNQRLYIYKFNDTNANGQIDAGEGGLAGWTFLLQNGTKDVTLTTNETGVASYPVRPGTTYKVTEFLQAHWISTTGTQKSVTTDFSTCDFRLEFGNFKQPKLVVRKFDDTHNFGKRDPDERGIANWNFTIRGPIGNPGELNASISTDDTGNATYYCPLPGRYDVKEITSKDWINTTPDIAVTELKAREEVILDFGNHKLPPLCCNQTSVYPSCHENNDMVVCKYVTPDNITSDMKGKNGETLINYTIQICPREKAASTDLAIALNEMMPPREENQKTVNTIVDGVSGFIDDQTKSTNSTSSIGLIMFNGTEALQIMPTNRYDALKEKVGTIQFKQTEEPSKFVDYTYGIAEPFYRAAPPNTSKIMVLVTDSQAPVLAPTAKLGSYYTVYAIVIGSNETDTTKLLRNLTKERNGTLFLVKDATEMQNVLKELIQITAPTVLRNVQVVDTLPSYMSCVSANGTKENHDGLDWTTSTARWNVGDLSSGHCWSTTFQAVFCWKLPADLHQIEGSSRLVSQVTYTRADGSQGHIILPEGVIKIGNPEMPKKQPGFEGWISIGGLTALVYLLRRRNEVA